MKESGIRLLFVCNSPQIPAGVEKTVLLLLNHFDANAVKAGVLLNGEGPFADQLRKEGHEVEVVEARGRFSWHFARYLQHVIAQRRVDVVQLHLSRFYAPFLRRAGCGVIERLNMTRHQHGFYLMRNRWLDCFTARWIDRFIVVSESLRNQFIKRGYQAEKLVTVHNGIAIPQQTEHGRLRRELGLPAETPIVGGAGRLTAQKGMETFLEAAAVIAAQREDVCFVIAGDGELRGALETLSRSLGIADRVFFLGFRSDLLQIMPDFDVLLYPSRWEPFANTILEAMSLRVPIVATAVGGNSEALCHEVNGLLFDVDDAEAAAQQCLRILRDRELAMRLTDQALRDVQQYSVANMVKGHQRVYQEVAQIVKGRS